ncbi:MAG: anti-sigma factor, partial [Calditrichaeota bacterium]
MKTCLELEPLLAAYVDGVLEGSERNEVENHLQSCSACRELVDGQHALKSLLRDRYRTEVTPVHVRARIRRALA